ncbi:Lrp/AsnC family transcriptional regulator [uncultured Pseudomonas sp.]|uniref:Lrp/AsnC family transcriptional regulator n=1 Tax=uncultured Pseudomonas sp. TaxID=114707 RepID=UPI0025DF0C66|nr:Lrp/AsnC family transcriptional regulator [uncultured Pseudomonas sp.]
MELDKYDRMLLGALLENGRASFAQLARQVNLSAPAVAERVAKLEASGVITGYEAKVNLAKVGLPIQCIIELRLGSHGNQNAQQELYKLPELIQCYRVTGDPCVIMRAAVDSMEHLEDLLDRITRYGFSKTSMVLSTPVDRRLPAGHLGIGVRLDKAPVKGRADA